MRTYVMSDEEIQAWFALAAGEGVTFKQHTKTKEWRWRCRRRGIGSPFHYGSREAAMLGWRFTHMSRTGMKP